MGIIDAHAHLWERAKTPQHWIDPTTMPSVDRDFTLIDLEHMQVQAGVDASILVQSTNSIRETVDLLAMAARSDRILGVIGWVNLEKDVASQVAALRAGVGGDALVGIRHLAQEETDRQWLAKQSVDLDAVSACGLPFDLVLHPDQLAHAETLVASHPRTSFVLDHLGNPPVASGDLRAWRRDMSRIARHGNVVVKLSGITLQTTWDDWSVDDLREPVETALEMFGTDRVVFGTDWPLVLLAADAPSWVDIVRALTPGESHEAILSANARRLYLGDDVA